MADQTKKVSEFPIATNIAGTDRILILQAPDSNPTVKTITTNLLIANIAVVGGYVTTGQLSANLNNYVSKAQLPSLLNGGNANNALYLNGLPSSAYVNTAQLSSNLQNYVSSSQLAANLNNYITKLDSSSSLNQYAKITDLQIYVENLTANNTTYLGGVPASSYVNATSLNSTLSSYITTTQLTGNLNNYQTTAGLSGNVLNLTANNVTYVGSTLAANVVSDQSLAANLANYVLISNLSSYFGTASVNNSAYLGGIIATDYVTDAELTANLVNYTTFTDLADYISSQIIPSVAVANSALYIGNVAAANVVYYSNTSNYTILIGNSSANTIVNSSSIKVSSILANGGVGTAGQVLTSNGSTIYWNTPAPSTNVNAQYTWTNVHTFSANIVANSIVAGGSVGTNGQVLTSNGSTVGWTTIAGVNAAAQYTWSNVQTFSSNIVIGSVVANGTVGSNGSVLTSNGSTAYWGSPDITFSVGTFAPGMYLANEIIMFYNVTRPFTVPSGFANSIGYAATNASFTTVFSIFKNATQIGTITFSAANAVPAIAGNGASFVAGDYLKVVAPSSGDATLADISFTFKGVKN